MTDKQFAAHLESLRIIAEKSNSTEEVVEAIDRLLQIVKKPQ